MNDLLLWSLISLVWLVVWPFLKAAIIMYDINQMVKSARAMNPKAKIQHPAPGYWSMVSRCWWLRPKLGPFWCGYYFWRGPANWEVIQRN